MRYYLWSKTVLAAFILVCLIMTTAVRSEQPAGEFARSTIDLGVVVSDVEKAVKFYTEAIGFTEVQGFSVPGPFCADSGLTNGAPLKIRVLVLGEEESATKLKLMELPKVNSKQSNNKFIHSQLGRPPPPC